MPETRCCSLCGNPLDEWDLQEDFTIHKSIGYGSKYDLSEVHLQLCCGCFDKLVDNCKISPVVGEVRLAGECYERP